MMRFKGLLALVLVLCAGAVPASAQQTGAISGKVVDTSNAVLPGVTVEARSDVLPSPRVTVTEGNGEYRLPALPPGKYTLTFTLSGMQTVTAEAEVQLGQDTNADITMGLGGVTETVEVVATTSLVERGTTEIKSGISNEQILALPVGQEYRDLIRLIPAVQFTQDSIRGPSAGGSGQDNVYMFDGVNVTLPLFGTLASKPASHDIAQVTTLKGGARAVDFERSAGFSIDTVSSNDAAALTAADDRVDDTLSRAQLLHQLRLAILRLPVHYREIVVLCELNGLSYEEAAQVAGCPVGTVRSRLNRARRLLVERCKARWVDEGQKRQLSGTEGMKRWLILTKNNC